MTALLIIAGIVVYVTGYAWTLRLIARNYTSDLKIDDALFCLGWPFCLFFIACDKMEDSNWNLLKRFQDWARK